MLDIAQPKECIICIHGAFFAPKSKYLEKKTVLKCPQNKSQDTQNFKFQLQYSWCKGAPLYPKITIIW